PEMIVDHRRRVRRAGHNPESVVSQLGDDVGQRRLNAARSTGARPRNGAYDDYNYYDNKRESKQRAEQAGKRVHWVEGVSVHGLVCCFEAGSSSSRRTLGGGGWALGSAYDTTRKPLSAFRVAGVLRYRAAERVCCTSRSQEPPRNTRRGLSDRFGLVCSGSVTGPGGYLHLRSR